MSVVMQSRWVSIIAGTPAAAHMPSQARTTPAPSATVNGKTRPMMFRCTAPTSRARSMSAARASTDPGNAQQVQARPCRSSSAFAARACPGRPLSRSMPS